MRAAGALPAGFTALKAGANVLLTLGLPEEQTRLFAGQASRVTADAQAWLLAKGGRMRLTGPSTHAATCKLNLPTGRFFGKVQFADGSPRPPKTKFQGYLIPQAVGDLVGYGATVPTGGWETLPVRLEANGE